MLYACFVDLIVIFLDIQRRIRTKASNDQRVWQHPATTTDRVSLWWFADDRNAAGRVSLRSASTAAAAARGGRISVRQYSESAATGWGVIWKYPAACTVHWRIVWKHDDPTAARSRRISVREHHNSTIPGWRTLWRTTARPTTTGRIAFWWHAATNPAAGCPPLWKHPAIRH